MSADQDLRGLPPVFRKIKALLINLISGATPFTGAPCVPGLKNAAGNYIWAAGADVPGDVAGYAKGCLFVQTDGTNQSNTLYCNIGSETHANFNLVTVAAD